EIDKLSEEQTQVQIAVLGRDQDWQYLKNYFERYIDSARSLNILSKSERGLLLKSGKENKYLRLFLESDKNRTVVIETRTDGLVTTVDGITAGLTRTNLFSYDKALAFKIIAGRLNYDLVAKKQDRDKIEAVREDFKLLETLAAELGISIN